MIKKIVLLACITLSVNSLNASTIMDEPIVDERVELISIAFRMAGCDEYTSDMNKQYVDRINAHFQDYKEHKLIAYIKKIRNYGIGYDAVMHMAVHIGNAPDFTPIVKFNKEIPESRWGKSRGLKFLKLLRAFYQDADCASFFQKEQAYYKKVIEAFRPNFEALDLNWYTQFYGVEPTDRFKVIIAPGNGGNNYGPSLTYDNGQKEVYAIMGAWNFDGTGQCVFPKEEYFSILLHEFNHSFVNPILPFFHSELEISCTILFKELESEMRKQAYGDWEVMYNESVVRAAVVKYMIDHEFEEGEIKAELQDQFYRGFIWINDLVSQLSTYSENRAKYSSLKAYMPEMIKAYSSYSSTIENYLKDYNESRPEVVSISEFTNGATDVDTNVNTITINFDREMLGLGYSINYGSMGKEHFPEITNINYSEDKKSVVLEVKLKSNHAYQLVFTGRRFISKENVPLKAYEVKFNTN